MSETALAFGIDIGDHRPNIYLDGENCFENDYLGRAYPGILSFGQQEALKALKLSLPAWIEAYGWKVVEAEEGAEEGGQKKRVKIPLRFLCLPESLKFLDSHGGKLLDLPVQAFSDERIAELSDYCRSIGFNGELAPKWVIIPTVVDLVSAYR